MRLSLIASSCTELAEVNPVRAAALHTGINLALASLHAERPAFVILNRSKDALSRSMQLCSESRARGGFLNVLPRS